MGRCFLVRKLKLRERIQDHVVKKNVKYTPNTIMSSDPLEVVPVHLCYLFSENI